LDTREKIVGLKDLPPRLGNAHWLAVVGTFDPLTLAQADRLAELTARGRSIVAVVQPGVDSLLPAEARAALLAALRSVQLVVIADAASLPQNPQIEILQDEVGDRKRSAEFVDRIAGRQKAAV
jgi:hypothetical protein